MSQNRGKNVVRSKVVPHEENAMNDEARRMWQSFISAPENSVLLKRYAKSSAEPEPLFDAIGTDLGSSNEQTREQAFWVLVAATPELLHIVYERESRQPKWREGVSKDQRMVNKGMDIVTYLHRELVTKYRFRVDDKTGRNPQPFLFRAIKNWEIDEYRKRSREDSLDNLINKNGSHTLYSSLIPDPASSIEDIAITNISLMECLKEFRAWGCFSDNELDLLYAVQVDEYSYEEISKRLGIPTPAAARKRMSRLMSKVSAFAVSRRDSVLAHYLKSGVVSNPSNLLLENIGWNDRADLFIEIRHGIPLYVEEEKVSYIIHAITRPIGKVQGHIYLVESPYADPIEANWSYLFGDKDIIRGYIKENMGELAIRLPNRPLIPGTVGIPSVEKLLSESQCFLLVPAQGQAIDKRGEINDVVSAFLPDCNITNIGRGGEENTCTITFLDHHLIDECFSSIPNRFKRYIRENPDIANQITDMFIDSNDVSDNVLLSLDMSYPFFLGKVS
jgi:DNA-directed RNA polymerase specialized sigma24 family protein